MKSDIASKLKTLRQGRKLTQQELADKIGLNRATISNYEVGRRIPHLKELKLFSDFFGVSLDYFGTVAKDEVYDLVSRAREVFNNTEIPKEEKEVLYKEFMKLYLSLGE